MYSLIEFEVEIASICSSYPYVTYNGQILGTFKSRAASSSIVKPVSIWYNNFFQTYDVIPIQMVVSRTVSLIGKFYDDTTVIFVVPCCM